MPRITAATAPASVTGRPATWAGAAGPVWSTTSGCCPSGSGPSTFAGARRGADPAQVAAVRSGLPLYIAVGEADPVNAGLALLTPLTERYQAAGLTDVTVRTYPAARHEILNETNRDEVIAELTTWLHRVVASAAKPG
jgi:alpha-beta hydrolase superfamily lysophospholipase